MNVLIKEIIDWRAPAPLWNAALADGGERTRFKQPTLLRFNSESFMDELAAAIADAPEELASLVAQPEQWQTPRVGWVNVDDGETDTPIKLFQPAHNRFYMVAASLVCARAGLPERKVMPAAEEKLGLLIRRLVPIAGIAIDPTDAETYVEHAWIGNRQQGRWEAVTTPTSSPPGEERLGMYPLSFTYEGRPRRLLVGNIPVAGREVYETQAPPGAVSLPLEQINADPLVALDDPRKATWAGGPLVGLATYGETRSETDPPGADKPMSDDDARELLTFTLLDIVEFLERELGDVWQAILAESSVGLTGAAQLLYAAFSGAIGAITWREALRRTEQHRDLLLVGDLPTSDQPVDNTLTHDDIDTAVNGLLNGGVLHNRVYNALDVVERGDEVPGRAPADAAEGAAKLGKDGAFYVARCVYDRPRCEPFEEPVLSTSSRPFQMAAFFDPDAPARPVNIRMPLDTSIAGLRKFPKSVGVLMSNKLRAQVEQMEDVSLEEVDSGELSEAESGWGVGMICSLSIPIITLCAFIVLMIFIGLLNIVFWWKAFLKICLPIPVKNK